MNRAYCLTINNYTDADIDAFHNDKAIKYAIIGKEKGTEGTPHLQSYVQYRTPSKFTTVKNKYPRAHIEVAKGSAKDNYKYCSKDGDFVEIGTLAADGDAPWAAARSLAKEGRFEEINDGIYIRCKRSLHEIHTEAKRVKHDDAPIPSLVNEWIYGPPGSGKSRYAREANPNHYVKPINKWWDGYLGEDTVIIDDFELDHKGLSHMIKIWADHYPFACEVKGAVVKIRPKKIIITSNYSPEEIWTEPSTLAAITRRFNIIHSSSLIIPQQLATKGARESTRSAECSDVPCSEVAGSGQLFDIPDLFQE